MPEYLLFYIGLSLFIIHEMDAIHRQEWKMFPLLSSLNDRQGYLVFTVLHIPLLVAIFWLLTNPSTTDLFMRCFDLFMIVHLGLHLLFIKSKRNRFKHIFSWIVIVGIAVCGFLDLLLFKSGYL